MVRALALLLGVVLAAPAAAQEFPPLSGRVVDQANLLDPGREAALTQQLDGLEQASTRQLVVATVSDLQGYPIEDYGYRLGRAWKIGQTEANNGTILLVAPNERKVRIEVGYGLEPILTDAMSSLIIQNAVLPAFKAGDYPGGIGAGVDAIIAQLQAPPEEAEARAAEAAQQEQRPAGRSGDGGSILPLIFWGMVLLFVLMSMARGRSRRRFGRKSYGGSNWPIMLWAIANEMGKSSHRSGGGFGGWGGGGGGGWGGGGGFSGGGGSFGGGGASGSW